MMPQFITHFNSQTLTELVLFLSVNRRWIKIEGYHGKVLVDALDKLGFFIYFKHNYRIKANLNRGFLKRSDFDEFQKAVYNSSGKINTPKKRFDIIPQQERIRLTKEAKRLAKFNANGRYTIRLDKPEAASFKADLVKWGCLDFFTGNNGQIIGLSQVVYFVHHGFKALRNGFYVYKDSHHIHHLDGNPKNNSPQNLTCLSYSDHLTVSKLQRGTMPRGKFVYSPSDNPRKDSGADLTTQTTFNNQGRLIKNYPAFIRRVVAATLLDSTRLILKAVSNPTTTTYYIKEIIIWSQTILSGSLPHWSCSSELISSFLTSNTRHLKAQLSLQIL